MTRKHFTLIQDTLIEELRCRLVELQHTSGASIIHIQNEDPENLFCFAFKTLPTSSNGAPHILEHTVLCGSEKFPVRDPFFSMTRRSLNTFMNAFTGADCTCYPAASQIEKDFYNLMEVYADAVFHPKLDRLSFLQEGWRFDYTGSTLERKGIVFNEMKGALSSPLSLLHEKLSELLFPGSPYGYNSGGDPKVIPTITHEELKQFHRENYHPSRCLYYFYGSFPLEKHLQFLEKNVFSKMPPATKEKALPKQKKLKQPLFQEIEYPSSEHKKEDLQYISIGWLTSPCTDIQTLLSLTILDGLLMENDSSKLKRAILDTTLAQQATSSLESELAFVPYTLTLTGSSRSKEATTDAILNILQSIAAKGFTKKEIQRVLHQIELNQREIVRDNAPYGLTLFWKSALMKLHGIDPVVGLELSPHVAAIEKALVQNPRYFSDLIETYLVKNPHRVTVRITPSTTIAQKEERSEQLELKAIASTLTQKQKKEIVDDSKRLQKQQHQKEDLSVLPSIAIKDISKKSISYILHQDERYYFSDVFTNHISYVTLALPVPPIALKKPWLLKLYSLMLPQLGCGHLSWKKALEYMQEYTGGICSYLSLNPSVYDSDTLNPHFHIHGKALTKNLDKLLWLLSSYSTDTRLDETQRIQEILTKHAASLESSLAQSSLRYANLESDKHFSLLSHLNWQLSGRDYLHHIRQAVQEKQSLITDLQELKSALMPTTAMKIVSTSSEQQPIIDFVEKIPLIKASKDTTPLIYSKTTSERCLALDTGTLVSFSSLAFPAMPYSSSKAAIARLLAPLLDNLVLHRTIREQGGAYGTGASYNANASTFSFYAYRDPNIHTSYTAFYDAVERVALGKFTEDDLNEAKRECIQGLDDPVSPSSQAEIAFSRVLEGKTDSMRQKFRTKLLTATCSELQELAAEFLKENMPHAAFTTAAGTSLLKKEQELFLQDNLSFSTIVL